MTSNKDFVFGRHAGLDYLKTHNSDQINKVFLQHGVQEDFANQVYAITKKRDWWFRPFLRISWIV